MDLRTQSVRSSVMSFLMIICFLFPAHAQETTIQPPPSSGNEQYEWQRVSDLTVAGEALPSQRDFQVWQDKTFTRNSFDEDIKDVLKAIARMNDTPITFGEGVTDTITMEFRDKPLRATFQQLTERYGLAYYWDADTLHVYKPDISKTKDVLVQLEHLEMDDVKSALQRFGLLKKEIRIVFDEPTNTILLTGTEREINNIQEVIAVLEASVEKPDPAKPEIRHYPLSYARVVNTEILIGRKTVTVKGVVSILTEVLHLTQLGEKKDLVVSRQAESSRVITRQKGDIYKKVFLEEKKIPEEASETKKDLMSPLKSQAQLIKRLIDAEAGTIASDSRTNQIIIRDYPDKLDEYAKIIKVLDKPTKMVAISVHIVEASKDFEREFGIGYAGTRESEDGNVPAGGTSEFARNNVEDSLGNNLNVENLIPLGAAALDLTGYGLAGTFLYRAGDTTLAATLSAAETKGLGRIINKSTLLTMDNMQAIVDAKSTVTFKIESGGTDRVVESDSIEAGLLLEVTPHVIDGDKGKSMIELTINAERSSFNFLNTTDGIPEKTSTNLTTQGVIHEGQTLVIGGVFESRYSVSETGVPCLMNVPYFGYLFKTTSAENPKTNILFFLTPQVFELDEIPYTEPAFKQQVEGYQKELLKIDPEKQERLIEKHQDLNQK